MASSPRRLLRRWALRFSVTNRRRKAARIVCWLDELGCQTVLLIGVGDEVGPSNRNIVEHAVAEGRTVVASLNIQQQTSRYPLLRADARAIPMRPQSVDFALSNAIIEHVGDERDQQRMVDEHSRVAHAWAITTPNRWFPIESHTSVAVLHWSPRWRRRRHEFTRLLSRAEFCRLLPTGTTVIGHWWSPTFVALYSPPDD